MCTLAGDEFLINRQMKMKGSIDFSFYYTIEVLFSESVGFASCSVCAFICRSLNPP